MFKRAIVSVALLAATCAVAFTASPAVRAKAYQQWAQWTGWTEDARRADPVGFANHAQEKLGRDLELMQKTRRELSAEVGQLARKIREQEALGDQAMVLAGEFRTQYQQVSTGERNPVVVRGAAYTEAQVRSQVSMLLAEAEGYQQSVGQLREVKQEAETQIETLAVRISATEAQLAGLSAKRELLRARRLSAEGEQLLAQVDELMTGNAQLIEGNPVRTVRELMDAPTAKPGKPVAVRRVEEFLAQEPPVDRTPIDQTPVEVEQVDDPIDQVVTATKPGKRTPKKRKPSKPIFQQF